MLPGLASMLFLTLLAAAMMAPLVWMLSTSLDETANTELPDPPRFLPWSSQNAATLAQSAAISVRLGSCATLLGGAAEDLLRMPSSTTSTSQLALHLEPHSTATLLLDLGQRRFIRSLTLASQVKGEPDANNVQLSSTVTLSPDRVKATQTFEVSPETVSESSVEIVADRGSRSDDLFSLSEMTLGMLDQNTTFVPVIELLGGPDGSRSVTPSTMEQRRAGNTHVAVLHFNGPQLCKSVRISSANKQPLSGQLTEIRILDDAHVYPRPLRNSVLTAQSKYVLNHQFPGAPRRAQYVYFELANTGTTPATLTLSGLVALSVRQPSFINYVNVLRTTTLSRQEFGPLGRFGRYYANSLLVALAVTLFGLLLNALLAYPLSHGTFPGREAIFVFVLATMMIPSQVTMIAVYRMMAGAGLVNSPWALILPNLVSAYGVFLLVQGMRSIPATIIEAARIDGSSEWRTFWRIVLPLSKPVLATLGILTFLASWNSFIWPLIMINEERWKTLPLGLLTYQRQFTAQWGNMMAAATTTIVPVVVVFLLMQKQVIRGITMGGVKG